MRPILQLIFLKNLTEKFSQGPWFRSELWTLAVHQGIRLFEPEIVYNSPVLRISPSPFSNAVSSAISSCFESIFFMIIHYSTSSTICLEVKLLPNYRRLPKNPKRKVVIFNDAHLFENCFSIMDRKRMNTEPGLFKHNDTPLIKSVLDSWKIC